MSQFVAVIDIGKTNKKVALYDRQLHQIAFRQQVFAASAGADGILVEPVAAMWEWFGRTLGELYREQPFQAISVTTHGATIACLDTEGTLALPVVAYDNDLGEAGQAELDRAFDELVGDRTALQAETGTCDMPLLVNPAKALQQYRRWFGDATEHIARILNYPQYWGYRLTGVQASEPTYTFNHSYLHDIRRQVPSSAAHALGVAEALDSSFLRPWDRLGTLLPELQQAWDLPALPVTAGIHDSNAALLPYLVLFEGRDFVVNSTGTWCVAMHGVDQVRYADDELGLKIIFNIDALGGYRKVSFLMGGQDYGLYHELIGGDHVAFDAARVDQALAEPGQAIVPGAFPSQFQEVQGGAQDGSDWYSVADLQAGKRPAWFADQERAHDLLNVSLALQTLVALEHTDIGPATTVFVEGGFRQNSTYLAVLAALLGPGRLRCTSLEQATATGTALLGHALLADCDPQAFAGSLHIDEEPVQVPELPHLAAYAERFRQDLR